MRVLPILFIWGATVFSESNAQGRPRWLNDDSSCPSPEEWKACFCGREHRSQANVFYTTIECYNKEVNELNEAFKNLTETESVKMVLGQIDLEEVPKGLFEGIKVKRMEIFACNLNGLEENLPHLVGLEDDLEDLKMWYNSNLTKLKTGHLRNLKRLSLGENAVKELSDDWFDMGPTSLERIYIDKIEIEKLGDHAFANLTNLTSLYLIKNTFGAVKRSMFPDPAIRLHTLVLNDNNLASLPKDIFNDMPALKWLLLQNNKIERLENDTWVTIWKQLDTIDLTGNPLICDSHMHWMFNLHGPPGMLGTCASPDDHRGRKLINFINAKGRSITLFDI